MTALLTDGLWAPVLVLGFLGWLVPRLLSGAMPETVTAVFLLGLVSTALMLLLAGAAFAGLYLLTGVPLSGFFAAGIEGGIWHFLRLGAMSGIIWAPILALSTASWPGRWKENTW